jgi:hypothetical protein
MRVTDLQCTVRYLVALLAAIGLGSLSAAAPAAPCGADAR